MILILILILFFGMMHAKLQPWFLITRPDHSLQDVRSKVFPLKGRKVEAPEPEVVTSVPLPARRKERSLSSLVVNTPRVSAQATMTGRRTKPTRKASSLRSSSFSIEKPVKREGELPEDRPESSSSRETSNKFGQNTGQVVRETICVFSLSSLYIVLFPCSVYWFSWSIWFPRLYWR